MARYEEVDRVVVDRLVRGVRCSSATRAEMVHATRRLLAENYTTPQIMRQLHRTERSVTRYRGDVRRGRFKEERNE